VQRTYTCPLEHTNMKIDFYTRTDACNNMPRRRFPRCIVKADFWRDGERHPCGIFWKLKPRDEHEKNQFKLLNYISIAKEESLFTEVKPHFHWHSLWVVLPVLFSPKSVWSNPWSVYIKSKYRSGFQKKKRRQKIRVNAKLTVWQTSVLWAGPSLIDPWINSLIH